MTTLYNSKPTRNMKIWLVAPVWNWKVREGSITPSECRTSSRNTNKIQTSCPHLRSHGETYLTGILQLENSYRLDQFSTRGGLGPRGHLARSENIFGCYTWKVLLASSGQRPEMLINFLHHTRMAPAQRRILYFNGPVLLRFRSPGLHFPRVNISEKEEASVAGALRKTAGRKRPSSGPWNAGRSQRVRGWGKVIKIALPVRRGAASGRS